MRRTAFASAHALLYEGTGSQATSLTREVDNAVGGPVEDDGISKTQDGSSEWEAKDATSGRVEVKCEHAPKAKVKLPTQWPGRHEENGSPVGYGDYLEVWAEVGFTAGFKSPRLQIDSPTIEPSYLKGGNTPPEGTPEGAPGPFPAAREPHKANADSSKTTDSAVQWADNVWKSGAYFNANESGFNNPVTRVWTFKGGTVGPVTEGLLAIAPVGPSSLYVGATLGSNPDGSDLIKSSNLKVTMTDSDGVSLSNNFDVNWHLPYENFVPLGVRPDAQREVFSPSEVKSPSVWPGTGQIATFSYYQRNQFGEWLDGAASGLELASSASFKDPRVGLILAGLGMAAGEAAEKLDEGDIVILNNSDTWNEAVELTNMGYSCVPVDKPYGECVMTTPLVVVHYDLHPYNFDTYDSNGYAGQGSKVKRVPASGRAVFYAGQFEWQSVPSQQSP